MKIETLAVHAGRQVDPTTGAVIPPIHLSTTFERAPDGSFPHGHIYTRNSNPNRAMLEACLAQLEGGVGAVAFSSGTAAVAGILHSLSPSAHVVAPHDIYRGIRRLLEEFMQPWGLQVTFVDMTDATQVEQAIRPNTKLIWVETPSNPLLKIVNLARMAALAHAHGAQCACDNTFATPIAQNPLPLGADLVMHATTKYIGGHSDVLGGVVVGKQNDALFQRIRAVQIYEGAAPSPFDCWLLLRGIQTLPYRMRAHSENAMRVATFLAQHPRVEAAHYPGLKTHVGHELAAEQMRLFGGMVSFQVRGGRDEAMAVAAKLKIFTRATSLGGTESLVEHRASIEGAGTRTPENLLRLSVGLEHPEDLVEDLAQALN
jgi:cystathionine gamma-synthase